MNYKSTSVWTDSYLKGAVDIQSKCLDESIIKELAYYMQCTLIMRNPDCIVGFDDLLLDDPYLYSKYEGYTKGALETSSSEDFEHISYIFLKSAYNAIEDYEIEIEHIDPNFQGLLYLEYINITNHKTIDIFTPPETKQYFDSL